MPALLVDLSASKNLYIPIVLFTLLGELHVSLLFPASTLPPLVPSTRGCFPSIVLGDASVYEVGDMVCPVATSAIRRRDAPNPADLQL